MSEGEMQSGPTRLKRVGPPAADAGAAAASDQRITWPDFGSSEEGAPVTTGTPSRTMV
jgi:cell division septation protein DedD